MSGVCAVLDEFEQTGVGNDISCSVAEACGDRRSTVDRSNRLLGQQLILLDQRPNEVTELGASAR